MHPTCAQVTGAPVAQARSSILPWLAIPALLLLVVGGLVCVAAVASNKRKAATSAPTATATVNPDHVNIGANGYLWVEGVEGGPMVFIDEAAFDRYTNARAKGDKQAEIDALRGMFMVERGTRVHVLDGSLPRETRKVQILSGKHTGKTAVTYRSNVHALPPR